MTRTETRGRPSKLTRALLDKFTDLAPSVACVDDACAELDISPSTYRSWMRAGKEARSNTLTAQFRSIAMSSRIQQKNRLVSMLYGKAINGDVAAAKYLLDRVHRMAIVLEHSGPHGGPITHTDVGQGDTDGIDYSKLTDAQLESLHGILAAATVSEVDDDD